MSETRTAGEIEDILSSIRRLVSEDLRPVQRPQIVSRMVVEDRLILTPALRVVSSRPAAPVEAAPAPATPPEAPLPRLHLGAAEQTEPASRATVVDALAQAVDQQGLDWESDAGDPDAESLDWSSFSFTRRPMRDWAAANAANIESPPAPEAPFAAAPAVEDRAPEPEPWAQPDPGEPMAEPAPVVEPPAISAAWADSAEAQALADLDAATPAAETVAETVAEAVTPAHDQLDDIFSEDVLRELVRDLIREQLQGDLGERITRNIRKLVKAEIARALAVQSLE